MCMRSTNNVGGQAGLALGLGHLGNHLGPFLEKGPQILGQKFKYIYIFFFFGYKGKKLVLHFSSIFKKYQRIE